MENANSKMSGVVLVVEDEIPLQKAIRVKLEKNNFSVVTARTVKHAFAQLESEEKIDLIWLDHYLLGKDNGLDFLIQVKDGVRFKDIPVFVVSNTATPEKLSSYIKFGAEKYYTKSDYKLGQIIGDIIEALK